MRRDSPAYRKFNGEAAEQPGTVPDMALALLLRWPLHLAYAMQPLSDRSSAETWSVSRSPDLTSRCGKSALPRKRILPSSSLRFVASFTTDWGAEGFRGRVVGRALKMLYRPEVALYLSCPKVGPGLFVSHGFATILTAETVGDDCMISQQVTVGWSNKGGPPTIGNRVRINAGAKVLGPITIGDDAVIGANAVVIHDVPPGAVMGGVPARQIGRDYVEDRSSGRG